MEGIYYEIQQFKEKQRCEDKDLMIVMSEIYICQMDIAD